MMDGKKILVVAAVFSGLAIGAVASMSFDTRDKCEKTEQAIRDESNISGALACFQPGTIEVNLSERVEEGAELECVCRRSINGTVQLWPISKAS